MLESRDIAYFLYCSEHVLPITLHPDIKNETWNQVLACSPCNSYKGTFDPSSTGIPATEECRDRLIRAAKEYIERKRQAVEALFQEEKALVVAALDDAPDSAKAAIA